MRTHFIAQELQRTTGRRYREILASTWNEIYPERTSYPNLLSNRVKRMLEIGKFSSVELDNIQRSITPYAPVTMNESLSTEDIPSVPRTEHNRSNEYETSPNRSKIGKNLEKNAQKYLGVSPQQWPRIPRLKGSRKVLECVQKVNELMKAHLENQPKLEEILTWVYAGAITVCEENGIQLKQREITPRRENTPPWKNRLETKITHIRKNIGIIYTYLQTSSPTRKLLKSIRRITSQLHIQNQHEDFKHKLEMTCDKLKQKAKSLGNRLQRYNERVKRYKNNQLYYKNPKEFFRSLENSIVAEEDPPSPENMHRTWKEIWESEEEHDETAFWIRDAEREAEKYTMEEVRITEEDVKAILKKSNNWSAPGPDGVHNYWWKYFDCTHKILAETFQRALLNPSNLPEFLTSGITHMLPKGKDSGDPKNFRPITCLSTLYKILTGVITLNISRHIGKNNILAREQNGCRKDTRGCKELLIMDSLITKQAKKKQRNISVAWVDYKKAFDSIPHSWLLKTLQLYGVSKAVINLLKCLMSSWRTRLHVNIRDHTYTTPEVNIKRGLFQGDKLSTLWFCLAINFLSTLLNKNKYGYIIEKRHNTKINHQLYIDDLKLYAGSEDQLKRQLKVVASFTETIRMQMGLDKCAVVNVKRGRITEGEGMLVKDDIELQRLGPEGRYKYLGIKQGLEINSAETKTTFRTTFISRINKILQSKLNAKAMVTSMNTWAMPYLSYSFGVVKWFTSDLKAIDIQVRKLMTRHGIHHPHASVNRLYIPRKDGGRGLQSVEAVHHRAVMEMRKYFIEKNSPFFRALCEADDNITVLNLASNNDPAGPLTTAALSEEWHGKALHGRYPTTLKRTTINKEKSVSYLKSGYLFAETEGRLAAIQDQVVPTRAYLKNIIGKNIPSDKCRKCARAAETIQHVTSSCPVMAPREYTDRHNSMAKVYHQAIAIQAGLIKKEKRAYEYRPSEILENDRIRLYWDSPLITDRPIAHNRPDIVIFHKLENKVTIIDVTIPADDNIEKAYAEKRMKYHDLAFELKEIYKLTNTTILPLIISTNGMVERHLNEHTYQLGLEERLITDAQREVILWTTRIVRAFLTSA